MEKSLNDTKDQNSTMKGSKRIVEDNQNGPMEESKMNLALPETSTGTSNQFISQSRDKDIKKKDRFTDRPYNKRK